MSHGVYIKVFMHIVKDNEKNDALSVKLSEKIADFTEKFYCEPVQKSFLSENGTSCTETEFSFFLVISGLIRFEIDEILSIIDKLDNGSYGVLFVDGDYGVDMYKCYGNTEFIRISADDAKEMQWSSEDMMYLKKRFKAAELAEILGCEEDEICDEVEEQAEKLVPEIVYDIYDAEYYELFDECEAEEDDEEVVVRFTFWIHEFSTEQLHKWKESFENGELNGWGLFLEQASEVNECFENVMICPDEKAVLKFCTTFGEMNEIRFMQACRKDVNNENQ